MLPVDSILPQLRDVLVGRSVAVLQAPPGAGKTTRVPLALLGERWLGGRRILMLEPRRLAARAAATFMARQLGEEVGGTVGYRVRRDTRVGPRTRIEVVTEGVLTRMLQHDAALEDVGLVIFDEFHERSLHADLGLALTMQTRELLRDDLRVLVMSATLDGAAVAALIGDPEPAPVLTSTGRAFAVETRHSPRPPNRALETHAAAVVRRALADHHGDVLVFLPGAREIRRVARELAQAPLPDGTDVVPLHGTLDQAAQDRAVAASRDGTRKVVLATTIAQTSITIEGVQVVVDSGFQRVPRFSPRSGMTRLETVRVSRASADQRRGRAGRVAEGTCYRLWDVHEEIGFVPFDRPEILEADLAPLALELAVAGVHDPGALRWLDAPPASGLAQARELLGRLGALDADGRCTDHGRAMAGLGAHPRIAHMLLRAVAMDTATAAVACDVAALLGQRDILRFPADGGFAPDVDLRLRLEVLHALDGRRERASVRGADVDQHTARQAMVEAREWRRTLGVTRPDRYEGDVAGLLVAYAYPERIAQRRSGTASATRYLLRNGSGAVTTGAQSLADAAYLAVADIGGTGADARIHLAAPLAAADLEKEFATEIVTDQDVVWDPATRSVRVLERTRLGALVLREGAVRDPEPALVSAGMLAAVREQGLGLLPWSAGAFALRQRMAFLHAQDPKWPDVGDDALLASLEDWLGPHMHGLSGRGAIDRVDVVAALGTMLGWERRQQLDRLAPTHLAVPSGSHIRIDYSSPRAPVLAVRLQEVFGLHETPRIAEGRVPLTLHLLSPAHRPVQVTQDLAGFWRGSYHDVRREMKGRYPKHAWPDDPLVADGRKRRP